MLKSVGLALISLIAFGLLGCASFQGPGPYRSSGERTPASEGGEEPGMIPYSDGQADSASAPHFDWPVTSARLSRGFKLRKKAHLGIDLANRRGTPVMAAERGHVVYVGHGFHGYGRLVVIEHGKHWATLYAHLDRFYVHQGDTVKQGQVIAAMGRSGHATGVHLHFEVRQDRIPINPLSQLPQGFAVQFNPIRMIAKYRI